MSLLLLLLASAAYSIGGLLMKMSRGLTRAAPAATFVALFAGGSIVQALGMRETDLAVGYVVVLGVEAVLTLALSIFWLHETASPSRMAAVLVVVAGIIWLRRT